MFGSFKPQAADHTSVDNVLPLRASAEVDIDCEFSPINLVALHGKIIMSVVDTNSSVVEEATDDSQKAEVALTAESGSEGACVNGVCSISWKPKRPTAA